MGGILHGWILCVPRFQALENFLGEGIYAGARYLQGRGSKGLCTQPTSISTLLVSRKDHGAREVRNGAAAGWDHLEMLDVPITPVDILGTSTVHAVQIHRRVTTTATSHPRGPH